MQELKEVRKLYTKCKSPTPDTIPNYNNNLKGWVTSTMKTHFVAQGCLEVSEKFEYFYTNMQARL